MPRPAAVPSPECATGAIAAAAAVSAPSREDAAPREIPARRDGGRGHRGHRCNRVRRLVIEQHDVDWRVGLDERDAERQRARRRIRSARRVVPTRAAEGERDRHDDRQVHEHRADDVSRAHGDRTTLPAVPSPAPSLAMRKAELVRELRAVLAAALETARACTRSPRSKARPNSESARRERQGHARPRAVVSGVRPGAARPEPRPGRRARTFPGAARLVRRRRDRDGARILLRNEATASSTPSVGTTAAAASAGHVHVVTRRLRSAGALLGKHAGDEVEIASPGRRARSLIEEAAP